MFFKILANTAMPAGFSLLALMLVTVVLVSLTLLRLRQSLLVAYFLCGMLIANSGMLSALGQEDWQQSLNAMAEIGVMLLLFTLGMEFSLGELRYLRRFAFGGGALQMAGTLVLAAGVAALCVRIDASQVIVLGVACALSSTAISVKAYQDMGISTSPGARFALAVAIFQDLFIIGFLVLMPVLFPRAAVENQSLASQLILVVGKGLLFVAVAWVLARWVIPAMLHAVARTRSRELFTLTVAGLCIGVAFLAGVLELSLVLGAFVAGLAVSESIYKHRILADVQPLRDLFLTLFFVSVGLLIDLKIALRHWEAILLISVSLVLGKALLVFLIARRFRVRPKPACFAALGLASAGEFSLVLVKKVGELRPWPGDLDQILFAAMALSMASVPLVLRWAEPLGNRLESRTKAETAVDLLPPSRRVNALRDHVIICGYGPVGQALHESLSREGIPALIIELNADTVRRLAKAGHAVLFADVHNEETWQLAGVERCRLVAFTFPNVEATAVALPLVRQFQPDVAILARTKFSAEAEQLRALGVSTIILDEAESGRAIVRQALAVFEKCNGDAAV